MCCITLQVQINAVYAKRHGYAFRRVTVADIPGRLPQWTKVRAMRSTLPDFDFVVFVDSDAMFHSHNVTVESMIDAHMGGVHRLNCDVTRGIDDASLPSISKQQARGKDESVKNTRNRYKHVMLAQDPGPYKKNDVVNTGFLVLRNDGTAGDAPAVDAAAKNTDAASSSSSSSYEVREGGVTAAVLDGKGRACFINVTLPCVTIEAHPSLLFMRRCIAPQAHLFMCRYLAPQCSDNSQQLVSQKQTICNVRLQNGMLRRTSRRMCGTRSNGRGTSVCLREPSFQSIATTYLCCQHTLRTLRTGAG
jgi:hypothetical protein